MVRGGHRAAGRGAEPPRGRNRGWAAEPRSWASLQPPACPGQRCPKSVWLPGYCSGPGGCRPSLIRQKLMEDSCGGGEATPLESQDLGFQSSLCHRPGRKLTARVHPAEPTSAPWRRRSTLHPLEPSQAPPEPPGYRADFCPTGELRVPGFLAACADSPVRGLRAQALSGAPMHRKPVCLETLFWPCFLAEPGSQSLPHSHAFFLSHTYSSHGSSP